MKLKLIWVWVLALALFWLPRGQALKATPTPAPGVTAAPKVTSTPSRTATLAPEVTSTPTPTATGTVTPAPTVGTTVPYPAAPLCSAHDPTKFHTLWNADLGCHYDHEHGVNPFTPEVVARFPGLDIYAFLGDLEIGHRNPTSPLEMTVKGNGFKWQVMLTVPHPCEPFEGTAFGVSAMVVQFHDFGDAAQEFGSDVHSAAAFIEECNPANPNDKGYIYHIGFQDYGQRLYHYQGPRMPFANDFLPTWETGFGPYLAQDCQDPVYTGCRRSRDFVLSRRLASNGIWTSKHTGPGQRPESDGLFSLLFRLRDGSSLTVYADQAEPFTYTYLCSLDGGQTYAALVGCPYNNSTSTIHEIRGEVPAAWDNLGGWDTDPRVGRVTVIDRWTDAYGNILPDGACVTHTAECFPVKLINAFVGVYGSLLLDDKNNQFKPYNQAERDIYFCGTQVCQEGDPGAVSSGWIGVSN